MKKITVLLAVLFLAGCVSVKIPKYLQDKFPYKKKFYADFETTLKAAEQALRDTGWKISETANPGAFEQGDLSGNEAKQILIFTEVRQTPLILSSRYMNLNVFVRTADNGTEVEIRYASVVPVVFQGRENYKNDAVVEKVFNRISELLGEKPALP